MRSIYVFSLVFALASAPVVSAAGPVELLPLKDGDRLTYRLRLDPGFAASWGEVNVGRLLVRTPGVQQSFELDMAGVPADLLDLGPAVAGCALLLVDLGPEHLKGRPDAWRQVTHATKLVVCATARDPERELESRLAAGATLMAKVGSRIEVRPLANPALLRPGADLPVIAYLEGAPREGVEVTAVAPDGSRRYLTTDAVGAVTVAIDASGRWRIEYRETREEGDDLVAALVFEVLPASFWKTLGIGRQP